MKTRVCLKYLVNDCRPKNVEQYTTYLKQGLLKKVLKSYKEPIKLRNMLKNALITTRPGDLLYGRY